MGKAEIEAFLTYLAVERHVAASIQNQALNAIVFLYRDVLDMPISDELAPVTHARIQVRLVFRGLFPMEVFI